MRVLGRPAPVFESVVAVSETIPMFDIAGLGATVHGQPVLAVEDRLAYDLAEYRGTQTLGDLAAEITETLVAAHDAADNDEGGGPGDLYYVVVKLLDDGGVTDVHINAERFEGRGYIVYYPRFVPDGELTGGRWSL